MRFQDRFNQFQRPLRLPNANFVISQTRRNHTSPIRCCKQFRSIQFHQHRILSKSHMPQHFCFDIAQTICFKCVGFNFAITGDALRHLRMNGNVTTINDFTTSRCFVFNMIVFHIGFICCEIMGYQHLNLYIGIASATYE